MGSCGLESREAHPARHPARRPECLPPPKAALPSYGQLSHTWTHLLPQPGTQGDQISSEGDRQRRSKGPGQGTGDPMCTSVEKRNPSAPQTLPQSRQETLSQLSPSVTSWKSVP